MSRLKLLFIPLIFICCKQQTEKLKIESDQIKKNFYSNGILKSEGLTFGNNQPIGIWHYYDSTGILTRTAEYIKINGQAYINQDWYFDKNGDKRKNKGSHFILTFEKDTIKLNEPVKAKIDLVAPLFKNKNSNILVVVPKDYSINFNEDFSNLKEVNLDTTFNLNLEQDMKNTLGLTTDFGKSAAFGRYFNSVGKKKFRGIIVEYFYKDSITTDSVKVNRFENKKYFEKDIFVLDTFNK
ncbi:hypothetical protein SAMN05421824_0074 [Hyunsoonleella jejuensis]|uniref:MORN repeat variant n=1 Tax=Hyunsoonleella jejuensis TaxID=419940 RepID=A0A1H8ZY96_9FLAO|nr:hypothetical protein [Hyunsoonleella jejuensis]SEP69223.1 hypothetical protein SAMN05421824_0074 [Hyunsoonleella jejuensis]